MNFASSCRDGKNHLLCKMIGGCAGEEWEPITGKLFGNPLKGTNSAFFQLELSNKLGKFRHPCGIGKTGGRRYVCDLGGV